MTHSLEFVLVKVTQGFFFFYDAVAPILDIHDFLKMVLIKVKYLLILGPERE